MISAHYMAKTLREHGVLFVFAFVMIGLFQVLIVTLVIEVDLLGGEARKCLIFLVGRQGLEPWAR